MLPTRRCGSRVGVGADPGEESPERRVALVGDRGLEHVPRREPPERWVDDDEVEPALHRAEHFTDREDAADTVTSGISGTLGGPGLHGAQFRGRTRPT